VTHKRYRVYDSADTNCDERLQNPLRLCNKGADRGECRQKRYRYTGTCIHNALSGRASSNLEEASNIPRLSARICAAEEQADFRQCFLIGFQTRGGKVAFRSDALLALISRTGERTRRKAPLLT